MVGSSSTTRMRFAIELSARRGTTSICATTSPQLLDHPRLQEDEVLGEVGHPVGDALQVMGHHDQVGCGVHVGPVLHHALHQVVEDAVVHAVDSVIFGSNNAGAVGVTGDDGAEHGAQLLGG